MYTMQQYQLGFRVLSLVMKNGPMQGLLYLDGRNSQKYLHQDQAYF